MPGIFILIQRVLETDSGPIWSTCVVEFPQYLMLAFDEWMQRYYPDWTYVGQDVSKPQDWGVGAE